MRTPKARIAILCLLTSTLLLFVPTAAHALIFTLDGISTPFGEVAGPDVPGRPLITTLRITGTYGDFEITDVPGAIAQIIAIDGLPASFDQIRLVGALITFNGGADNIANMEYSHPFRDALAGTKPGIIQIGGRFGGPGNISGNSIVARGFFEVFFEEESFQIGGFPTAQPPDPGGQATHTVPTAFFTPFSPGARETDVTIVCDYDGTSCLDPSLRTEVDIMLNEENQFLNLQATIDQGVGPGAIEAVTAIPEPTTLLLLGSGLAGLGLYRRKRSSKEDA